MSIIGAAQQQFINRIVSGTANTVAPVISGDGADTTVMTSTDGTWTGTVGGFTYQWQSAGVDISGATANTYTVTTGIAGTDITLRVTNNGETATSNTVNSSPATLWTPANISTQLWLKAAAANITMTGTGDNVLTWSDLSGNGNHMTQDVVDQQVTFVNAAGGVVSAIASDTGVTGSITFDSLIAVLRIGDGTPTTFSKYNRVGETPAGWKIRGFQNQNYWDPSSSTSDSFVNGASTSTNIATPMVKSIQRFAFPSQTSDVRILHGGSSNQGWDGPIWEYVIPNAGTSAADMTRLEGYLAWEHGLVADLDPSHLYKSAAPTT